MNFAAQLPVLLRQPAVRQGVRQRQLRLRASSSPTAPRPAPPPRTSRCSTTRSSAPATATRSTGAPTSSGNDAARRGRQPGAAHLQASQGEGKYLTPGISALVAESLPLAGSKSDWFSDVLAFGTVGYYHLFSKCYAPCNNIAGSYPRQAGPANGGREQRRDRRPPGQLVRRSARAGSLALDKAEGRAHLLPDHLQGSLAGQHLGDPRAVQAPVPGDDRHHADGPGAARRQRDGPSTRSPPSTSRSRTCSSTRPASTSATRTSRRSSSTTGARATACSTAGRLGVLRQRLGLHRQPHRQGERQGQARGPAEPGPGPLRSPRELTWRARAPAACTPGAACATTVSRRNPRMPLSTGQILSTASTASSACWATAAWAACTRRTTRCSAPASRSSSSTPSSPAPASAKRFLQEARASARITSPHVVARRRRRSDRRRPRLHRPRVPRGRDPAQASTRSSSATARSCPSPTRSSTRCRCSTASRPPTPPASSTAISSPTT